MRILVRRPEPDDPLPPPLEHLSGLAPRDILEFQTRDTDHIIESLWAIETFRDVSYLDSLTPTDPSQDLLIRPFYLPLQPHCDGDQILLVFFTLGVMPAECTRDKGIYFEVIDRKLPPFLCPWPQSELVGWFPVLLATGLGSWTRRPDDDAFVRHIRACVSEQADLFVR